MSSLDWLTRALNFWREKNDEVLRWRRTRHPEVFGLRKSQALAEQDLIAELKKKAAQLAHDLALIHAKNQTELAMTKIQCKQDLKDYQQYLNSLDQLKTSFRIRYAHLPEALAFTIHHHAKQLLDSMWEAKETQEKLKIEMQLIRFMTAVHEDSQFSTQNNEIGRSSMPIKTLAFIDNSRQIG